MNSIADEIMDIVSKVSQQLQAIDIPKKLADRHAFAIVEDIIGGMKYEDKNL